MQSNDHRIRQSSFYERQLINTTLTSWNGISKHNSLNEAGPWRFSFLPANAGAKRPRFRGNIWQRSIVLFVSDRMSIVILIAETSCRAAARKSKRAYAVMWKRKRCIKRDAKPARTYHTKHDLQRSDRRCCLSPLIYDEISFHIAYHREHDLPAGGDNSRNVRNENTTTWEFISCLFKILSKLMGGFLETNRTITIVIRAIL